MNQQPPAEGQPHDGGNAEAVHNLLQLSQNGTTAAYRRTFYDMISGGTPGISNTELKQIFLLGLRWTASLSKPPHLAR